MQISDFGLKNQQLHRRDAENAENFKTFLGFFPRPLRLCGVHFENPQSAIRNPQ